MYVPKRIKTEKSHGRKDCGTFVHLPNPVTNDKLYNKYKYMGLGGISMSFTGLMMKLMARIGQNITKSLDKMTMDPRKIQEEHPN